MAKCFSFALQTDYIVFYCDFNIFYAMRSSGSFISGILIGVLAAFGIVFLLQFDFSWLPFGGSKSAKTDADTVLDLTASRSSSSLGNASKRANKTSSWSNNSNLAADSSDFVSDSSSGTLMSNTEEIVVRRDELVSVINVSLVQLTPTSKTDSLLTLFQGENPSSNPQIRVEFWRSPVNFRGYKFIRNTLVTFGLDAQEQVKIYLDGGFFYLQSAGVTYRLSQTDRFMPFSLIAEESIPKQIRS